MKKFVLVCLFLGSFSAFGGFPKNDLWIGKDDKGVRQVTEKAFNKIIDVAKEVYSPIFKEKGFDLEIGNNWDDGTVNAYAYQSGKTAHVEMFGGMARHPEMSPDGFLLVLCHEIGHHLAGEPLYTRGWASVEGQSDYWGAKVCMRKILEDNRLFRDYFTSDEIAKQACKDKADKKMCYRISMAGRSLGRVLASLRRSPMPEFDTPDHSVVDTVFEGHPMAQCRLDTYFSGALEGERPECWFANSSSSLE